MNPTDRILTGVALMIGFCIFAPLIDVASKLAAQEVPVGVVTLGRFVVQGTLMAPVVILMGLSFRLTRRTLGLTTLRAIMSIASTYCFVAAVKVMPIADALAIAFVEPFIILLIGKLVLSEQVGPAASLPRPLGSPDRSLSSSPLSPPSARSHSSRLAPRSASPSTC
jgi:drug/metabolite transporter (DMT)-like permease